MTRKNVKLLDVTTYREERIPISVRCWDLAFSWSHPASMLAVPMAIGSTGASYPSRTDLVSTISMLSLDKQGRSLVVGPVTGVLLISRLLTSFPYVRNLLLTEYAMIGLSLVSAARLPSELLDI